MYKLYIKYIQQFTIKVLLWIVQIFINISQLVTLSCDKLTLAVIVREDNKEKIISILRVLICRCPAILCRPGNNSYLSCSLLLARKSVKILHFTFYNYI